MILQFMHENFQRIVTLFRIHQDTGEDRYKKQAEALLNEMIDYCKNSKSLSYYNGFCGIGSLIEYLIKNLQMIFIVVVYSMEIR